MNYFFKGLSGLALISLSFSAVADIVTIEADNWGWYTSSGVHDIGNPNTWTGTDGISTFRNSFYNFDVSVLANSSQIISATINFGANNGRYDTPDNFETLEIWDVNTTPGLGNSTQVYTDLMTGNKYGETNVQTGGNDAMPGFSVELSSLSFSDILADGFFSLGAHVSSLSPGSRQILWSGSGGVSPAATLTIEYTGGEITQVHEPGILAIIGLGLLSLGYTRRSPANQRG